MCVDKRRATLLLPSVPVGAWAQGDSESDSLHVFWEGTRQWPFFLWLSVVDGIFEKRLSSPKCLEPRQMYLRRGIEEEEFLQDFFFVWKRGKSFEIYHLQRVGNGDLPSPLYSLHFLWCFDDLDLEVEKKTSPPKVSAFLKKDKDSLLFMCKMIKSSPPPISHLPNLVLLMQGGIDSPAQIMLGWILQLGICWILSKQTYLAYFPCLTHYFSRNWQFPAFLFLTHPPASTFSPIVLCVMKVLVIRYCPTLYHPMDCSPPGSSVHGILQAKILEWVAIPDSSANLQPRAWTQVSCIAGRFFTIWATIFPLLNMVINYLFRGSHLLIYQLHRPE